VCYVPASPQPVFYIRDPCCLPSMVGLGISRICLSRRLSARTSLQINRELKPLFELRIVVCLFP